MSYQAIDAVARHSELKGTARLIMVMIAHHANDDGYAWPSVCTLAQECRTEDRYCRKVINQAIELGELEKIEQGGGSGKSTNPKRTNRYRIALLDKVNPVPQYVFSVRGSG